MQPSTHALDSPRTTEVKVSSPTILIVDDEPGVRDLLSDALGMSGYLTLTAPDGIEALNILHRQSV
ncbi:MAG: response regulator, partial [Actinobacteria bacterium]|nr:response regulator [Actinomycetota bacterium]